MCTSTLLLAIEHRIKFKAGDLRRLPYGRESPAHRRHLSVFSAAVPTPAVPASNLRNTPSTGGNPGRARPASRQCRGNHRTNMISFPGGYHPHPPTFCNDIVVDPEGPEHDGPCSARATVAQYHGRGAHAAGHRRRGNRAGRVDRARAASASRNLWRRGRGHEGTCKAEMSTPAAELSPPYVALYYPVPVHIPCIIWVTVNIVVANQTKVGKN